MSLNLTIIEPTLVSYQEDGGEFTLEMPSTDSYAIFTLNLRYDGHIPNCTKWTARFTEFSWGSADTNNIAKIEFMLNNENKIVEYSFRDLLGYGLELDWEYLVKIFPALSDFNKLIRG